MSHRGLFRVSSISKRNIINRYNRNNYKYIVRFFREVPALFSYSPYLPSAPILHSSYVTSLSWHFISAHKTFPFGNNLRQFLLRISMGSIAADCRIKLFYLFLIHKKVSEEVKPRNIWRSIHSFCIQRFRNMYIQNCEILYY